MYLTTVSYGPNVARSSQRILTHFPGLPGPCTSMSTRLTSDLFGTYYYSSTSCEAAWVGKLQRPPDLYGNKIQTRTKVGAIGMSGGDCAFQQDWWV